MAAGLEILLLDFDFDVKFLFVKSLRLALDTYHVILGVSASLGLFTKSFNDKFYFKDGLLKSEGPMCFFSC